MEQSEEARAIPQVELPCGDQVSGRSDKDPRRRFIPEASDLALLGGSRLAVGPADAFDFVVIGHVLRATQFEVAGTGRFEFRDAGNHKRLDPAEAGADSRSKSGRRWDPDAQP